MNNYDKPMSWFRDKRIFLDYASATPILSEVEKVMREFGRREFYNSSAIYEEAQKVKKQIENYRIRVSKILGAGAKNIVFTSGGTESDNLAILGAFEESLTLFKKPHLIISAVEHPAITAVADEVVRRGGKVSTCEVDTLGIVSPEEIARLLRPSTFLVSVSLANSEIGTVEPIAKIGRQIRQFRRKRSSLFPYFHTDASQAVNYIDVNIERLQVDLLTLDSSKIYGPKGIGLLAMRGGVRIQPIIFGGSQERGLRAGTLSQSLISGLAVALDIVAGDREKESKRLSLIRNYFLKEVKTRLPQVIINGSKEHCLPNIISLSLPGVLSELIVLKLDNAGVMASVGTACSLNEKVSGSPIMRAIGRSELAESTVRLSLGRGTTEKDIKKAVEIFCRTAQSMVK